MNQKAQILKPWSVDATTLMSTLDSAFSGLSSESVESRSALYGKNTFKKRRNVNVFLILARQFASPLIFVLIGASILTLFLHEWIDSIVILLAVFVNAGLGFYQEYHAENTLQKLITYIKEPARVLRDKREIEIDSIDLVPGDIVKLSYGARVPADVRILSETGLSINESILTGESAPVSKTEKLIEGDIIVADRKNMAFAGTFIADGYGTGIVVATGLDTELGKIADLVSGSDRQETPIQKSLSKIAWLIFAVVSVIVVGMFILGISRGEGVFDMILLSVAVSVGAVPEALPIALTVILAVGAERILKNKGVIRTLVAAETLGSTTVIMTDKTGTLTKADMTLVDIVTGVEIFGGLSSSRTLSETLSPQQRSLLTIGLSSVDVTVINPTEKEEDWILHGRPFEVNIAKAARLYGIPIASYIENTVTPVVAFNSTHKFSAWIEGDKLMVMGAPDVLLRLSNLSSSDVARAESFVHKVSSEGGRLIGIASMGVSSDLYEDEEIKINKIKNLDFSGLLVFHDPIRPEVPDAIRMIEVYGTKVIMVTGDLKGTALSVARDLGWEVQESEVLSGEDFQNLSDDELFLRIQSIKIFARVTPEDKLRIGLMLKRQGEVVAMTGDGVNDAPSLKSMDVGIALGSGSDVAKSAADIVLLDDNFKTIALAVGEGRRILSNIRKTFVYLMSNSLDEVILIGGSLLVSLPLPLTTLQIIWVNLFTGSLPALAFAFDPDYDKERAGTRSLKSLLTNKVKVLTLGIGIVTSVLLFLLYFVLLRLGFDVALARSILFVCFSSYVLIIAFSFRSLSRPLFSYPVFSNMKLNASILIAFGLLVITMTVPFMRNLFELAPLDLSYLWIIGVWLVFNVLIVEAAKWVFRRSGI